MNKTMLASRMLQRSGLGPLLRKTSGHRGFVVLNYHRIGEAGQSELDRGVYSASADAFEQQLRFLKHNCDVILPGDIADLPTRGRGNFAMITFDDGYRDNHDLALPLLEAAGLKAVFFVATGFIDSTRLSWWDEIAWMVRHSRKSSFGPTSILPISVQTADNPQEAIESLLSIYKRLPAEVTELYLDDIAEESGAGRAPADVARDTWMTWDMVREMRRAGMVIGGHTVNHPILSTMPRAGQQAEIAGCARTIAEQLSEPMEYFAYPRGKLDAFNDDTRTCLRASQVKYAFTYYGGMNHTESIDPLDVRRVPVESDTAFEHFEAMVTLPMLFA